MNKSAVAGIAALGAMALAALRKRQTGSKTELVVSRPRALEGADSAAHKVLAGGMIPLWIGAGLADYLLHRRTKIELTSGPRESLLHLIMLCEGAPVVLGPMLLDVNAGVLAMVHACWLAHQGTAMWDVDTTTSERLISSDEQHVHAFLEGVPLAVAALYTVLHWKQFGALMGTNNEKPRFHIRLKEPRVTLRDAALVSAAVLLFDVLPHLEEYWRCLQAKRRGLTGTATPGALRTLFAGDKPSLNAGSRVPELQGANS